MQKNNFIIAILLILFLSSCTNKKVQLPMFKLEGIPQIHNHSSVWVFYKIKDQDTLAVLNKNNKIINTNWIFNIDKRLTMDKVQPILTELQINKNKPSMHKKGGTLNYYSYADMSSDKISLIHFKPTTYIFTDIDYQNLLTNSVKNKIIELEIKNDHLVLKDEKINNEQLLQRLETIQLNDTLNNLKILLKYHKNTAYQNYLKSKAFLDKITIPIDSTEYIYSLK